MNKTIEKLMIVGVVCLVLFLGVLSYFLFFDKDSDNSPGPAIEYGQIREFTGKLTDFDSSCAFDSQCIAEIDGKYSVLTNPGLVISTDGEKLKLGKSDVGEEQIGKMVKVRAIQESENGYTIVGDESLYVLLK